MRAHTREPDSEAGPATGQGVTLALASAAAAAPGHVPGAAGAVAVIRYVHVAGPQARLSVELVQTRENVEAEISRTELTALGLGVGDLVRLRLRQSHSFDDDYAI